MPAPAPAPAAAGPAVWRMRCLCGVFLEVPAASDGRQNSCETCHRAFKVTLTQDVVGGRQGMSLVFLSGPSAPGRENESSGTTAYLIAQPDGAPAANPHRLLLEPEPPDEAQLRCDCGSLLVVPKALYDQRTKCPDCGARRLVIMIFDLEADGFTLQWFGLDDASSGTTQILKKL